MPKIQTAIDAYEADKLEKVTRDEFVAAFEAEIRARKAAHEALQGSSVAAYEDARAVHEGYKVALEVKDAAHRAARDNAKIKEDKERKEAKVRPNPKPDKENK